MTPFRIDIPQAALDDLADRLRRTRFVTPPPTTGWDRGVPVDHLRDLVAYWADKYDWRAAEARLNEIPQYRTEIDGQPIHFLHVRSPEPDALPLVVVHGWPGSIVEFQHVIGPLTDPRRHGGDPADAFHLVVPALPGFGFSAPPASTGWHSGRVASAFAALMTDLGYDRFGAQGGDLGALVAPDLGREAPDRVVGVHVNAASFGFIPLGDVDEAELTAGERVRLARIQAFHRDGNGYFQLQATRPDTLAHALTDSPAGQLAWIVEKFHEWSHGDDAVDRDTLLTNVMLYWLTATAGSAAAMYYENMHAGAWPVPSGVPTGVANFAEDIAIRRYAEEANTIVHWAEYDRGGHFAALEAPDLFVDDVRAFFRGLR